MHTILTRLYGARRVGVNLYTLEDLALGPVRIGRSSAAATSQLSHTELLQDKLYLTLHHVLGAIVNELLLLTLATVYRLLRSYSAFYWLDSLTLHGLLAAPLVWPPCVVSSRVRFAWQIECLTRLR